MRIVSVTPWYNEPPENLWKVAVALAGLADCAVWVDGAFAKFPDGKPVSPREQREAIMDGCGQAGVECAIYQPAVLGRWGAFHHGDEVPKRNFTLRFASRQNPDWLLIVDADWEFFGDAAMVRRRLLGASSHTRAADGWVVGWGETRVLYRWDPGMSYSRTHYYLRAGDGRTLWCPILDEHRERHGIEPQVEGIDMTDLLTFDHLDRKDGFRDAAARAYYELRDREGIEELLHREISTGETA